jgi:2-polyprenyl-3-methyl-5-hydroxy-6-metoxy-1,4-benzoquinol methylase
MGAEDAWKAHVDRFVDRHYASLRGRARTHVIAAHLNEHLPGPPAALVDVGGGAGNQSIPLARDGYTVALVDPSAAMLGRAQERLADEPPEVRDRVRLIEASAEQAREILGSGGFAGVLCHGVIMYLDDPCPLVRALADLADTGGIVSVVAKNAAVLATRPALEGRWADALAAFDTNRQVNGLGLDTRADTIDGLTTILAENHVQRIAWYGVTAPRGALLYP